MSWMTKLQISAEFNLHKRPTRVSVKAVRGERCLKCTVLERKIWVLGEKFEVVEKDEGVAIIISEILTVSPLKMLNILKLFVYVIYAPQYWIQPIPSPHANPYHQRRLSWKMIEMRCARLLNIKYEKYEKAYRVRSSKLLKPLVT
jgi:hypothetical protein